MKMKSSRTRAIAVHRRLQELYHASRRNFVETGHLVVEVERDHLWRELESEDGRPYRSFDQWVSRGLLYGRSTVLAARDMVRKFEGVPDATLQQIPRANLVRIAKLPPAKRKSDKWIQAALTMPTKDLSRELKTVAKVIQMPAPHRVTLTLEGKALECFTKAIERAQEALGASASREECIYRICTTYLKGSARKVA